MDADRPTIFAEPWWLEAVAPNQWGIATVTQNGATQASWPYTITRLPGGLIQIGAAPLCPYLGPTVEATPGSKRPKQISSAYSHIAELVEQLPKHDIAKLKLRADQGPWYALHIAGFEASARQTYVIDDLTDPAAVWEGFSSSTRRNIRKAEKQLVVSTESDSRTLWQMVSATFDRQGRNVPYSTELLQRCVGAAIARDRGRVVVARDRDGNPHAAMFVVWDDDRAYYLVGGADPARRESAGLSLLMADAIKHAGSTSRSFDFEGSMVPSIEKFFAGFGGRPETHLEVLRFSRRGKVAWTARSAGVAARDALAARRAGQ